MKKVAILTNFLEFLPGYSLTGIVKDQMIMFKRNGDDPHLFVSTDYHGEEFSGFPVHKKVPFSHLKDYRSIKDVNDDHKKVGEATGQMMIEELKDFDFGLSHDWIFTGWNLPYYLGILKATPELPGLRWFHWIHSVPTAMSDWWIARDHGPTSRIIYPNKTDSILVAEQYRGTIEDVRTIHHIKDMRTFADFDEETIEFIDKIPGMMSADIVQLLPASQDRLSAKRVNEVISIFGHLNRRVTSVCLVIANQWATEKYMKEDISKYLKHAEECGLTPGEDVVFTSEIMPKYQVGIPKRMIRELFSLTNLFVFPTREESFGLVIPEAALNGVLMVLNRSLDMQREVAGDFALFFDFGSYRHNFNNTAGDNYYRDIALIILGRLQNEITRSKTFARKSYNMDALYQREYAPLMAESKLWPTSPIGRI